jgi:hypothetical protein
MEQIPHIKTYGEVLARSMIELVPDDIPNGRFNLLFWDGTQAYIQPSFPLIPSPGSEFKPRVYEAPDLDPTISQAIRFPTHTAPYESCRKLFDDLCALVERFTGLSESQVFLSAYCVLASWFPECSSIPICVSIVGPYSAQGSQLFQLLSCLYRRPLLLGEMSVTGLHSLPLELCPSVFIERYEYSAELQRLLCALNAYSGYIPRKGRLVSLSFARVVCTEEPPNDDALGGRAIKISVSPTCRTLPLLEKRARQEIADEFQPKLLMYRLTNYSRVAKCDFDVPYFLPPVRELARFLGACGPDAPEFQQQIIALLKERNEEVQTDRSTNLCSFVVEAMLSLCHEFKRESVRVAEVADRVNTILSQRGEMLTLNAKAVGTRLSKLHLYTKRLDAKSRGLLLTDAALQLIHKLAEDYQIVSTQAEKCPYCKAFPHSDSGTTRSQPGYVETPEDQEDVDDNQNDEPEGEE